MLSHKVGEKIKKGERLASVFAEDKTKLAEGLSELGRAISVGKNKPSVPPLILGEIG